MNLPIALYVFATVADVALAALVYFHGPRKLTNRLFAGFAVAVGGWTMGIAATTHLVGSPLAIITARFTFASACLSIYALWAFLIFFPSYPSPSWPPTLRALSAAAALLVVLSFTPWLVTDITLSPRGLKASYGPVYYAFAAFIFFCIGHSLLIIRRKLQSTEGRERLQITYLFFGLIIPGLLATATNLAVPLVFRSSHVSHYGPLSSLIMVALVAHTIIRHRLMNIQVFISRGVAYVLAVGISGAVFWALLISLRIALLDSRFVAPSWTDVGAALLIALLFQPLKRFLQRGADTYLYRQPYDYRRTLRDATIRMAAILDLSSLLEYLSEVIKTTTRAESIGIYISAERGSFERIAGHLPQDSHQPTLFPSHSPIPAAIAHSDGPILLDELVASHEQSMVSSAMADIGAQLILPMLADNQLISFIVLGRKRSGDPYFPEDIDLLSVLASQASVAIKNAQLYRQVVQVNDSIENILATMESGVIAVNRDGVVTLVNRAAERMAGVETDGYRNRPLSILPSALRYHLASTLEDGQPRLQLEAVLSDSDGRLIPIVCSTTAFHQNGFVVGAVIVFSDLTRLKQLEAEKRRAERLASLGALASGIAHEIKNPLVAIRTFAELLPERFSDAEFRDSFSQVALTEIERIDHLVARLRGLALPSGRQFGSMDLRQPLDETLVLLRGQLEQKHISVLKCFPATPTFVSGDFPQLKQLFLNVFLNAIDAMAVAGTLTVRLTPRGTKESPQLSVEICDTGVGIPHSVLDTIFDPFVTTKTHGSGLGLAICRGIADAHGATIRAQNNLDGPGATVTVTFPLLEPSHPVLTH